MIAVSRWFGTVLRGQISRFAADRTNELWHKLLQLHIRGWYKNLLLIRRFRITVAASCSTLSVKLEICLNCATTLTHGEHHSWLRLAIMRLLLSVLLPSDQPRFLSFHRQFLQAYHMLRDTLFGHHLCCRFHCAMSSSVLLHRFKHRSKGPVLKMAAREEPSSSCFAIASVGLR